MSEVDYEEAKTVEDMDEVTRVRIGLLFGSIDEEFKLHREAILAIATMIWGKQSSQMTTEKATQKVKDLLKTNEEIEKIVSEGRIMKKQRGFLG